MLAHEPIRCQKPEDYHPKSVRHENLKPQMMCSVKALYKRYLPQVFKFFVLIWFQHNKVNAVRKVFRKGENAISHNVQE